MSASALNEPNVGRAAVILFSACLIGLVAIWLFNVSLHSSRIKQAATLEAFSESREMLNRLQLFRQHAPSFFVQYTFTMLKADPAFGKESSLSNGRLQEDLRQFAVEVIALNSTESNTVTRQQTIAQKYRLYFQPMVHPIYDDIAILSDTPLSEIWGAIASWIVYNRSPPRVHDVDVRNTHISYVERYPTAWGNKEQKRILYNRLRADGEKNAEAILSAENLEFARRVAGAPSTPREVGLSGLGIAVSVPDALAALPLILVILAAHFSIVRAKDRRASMAFPQYHSSNDPLFWLGRPSASEIVQRTLWAGFLALPLLLVAIAIAFRYDFATPFQYPHLLTSLSTWAVEYRGESKVDALIDTCNIAAVICLLVYIHVCTAPSDNPLSLSARGTASAVALSLVVAIGLGALSVVTYRLYVVGSFEPEKHPHQALHWYSVGMVWLFAASLMTNAVIGATQRRRFSPALSLVILLALMISLIGDPVSPDSIPRFTVATEVGIDAREFEMKESPNKLIDLGGNDSVPVSPFPAGTW